MSFDCVVVGGGIVGIAAAWRSALHGQRTLLLERFGSMLHTRGSSHGRSRIIRRTYPQDHYTRAMADAYELWHQAEAEAGAQIVRVTGGLDLASRGNPGLAAIARGCERFGVSHERLSASEVAMRFPLIRPPDFYEALFSPEAGVIDADGARESLLKLALRAGCTLRTDTAVVDIAEDGAAIRLDMASASDMGSCGARVRALLWEPTSAKARAQVTSSPVFIDYSPAVPVYGMPDPSGLLKVAAHDGPFFRDADKRDEQDDETCALAIAGEFIGRCLPDIDRAAGPARTEHCMYTMTPDEDFILDTMQLGDGRLVIGASCSGHGFKLAPWVGEALAGLARGDKATGRSWHRSELGPFRADRAFGSFDAPCIMGQRAALVPGRN